MIPEPYSPELALNALNGFENRASGWRADFAIFFRSLAAHAVTAQLDGQSFSIPATDALWEIFDELADFFSDLEIGARHPLGFERRLRGRRPANSLKARFEDYALTLIGLEMKRRGRSREQSFRASARRLSRSGIKVDWRFCRALWQNRARSRDWPATLALLNSMPSEIGEDYLNALADLGASYFNQNTRFSD